MSFAESMNQCLRSSIPVLFLALTFCGLSLASASQSSSSSHGSHWFPSRNGNATETPSDFTKNDLLLGSQDTFFWFLVPLFGLMCTGVCVAINYVTLIILHVFGLVYTWVRPALRCDEGRYDSDDPCRETSGLIAIRRSPTAFAVSSTKQRVITTGVLLLMVSTAIPYHFAYMVLCVVHIATTTRSLRIARETVCSFSLKVHVNGSTDLLQHSEANYNFFNYCQTILVLMIWILPINIPVLVVWVRNLAVHWLTPFSSHHNILSIMPFILLVETLSTGRMVPRVTNRYVFIAGLAGWLTALTFGKQVPLLHQHPPFQPGWLRRHLRCHLRLPPPPHRQHSLRMVGGDPPILDLSHHRVA